MEEADVLSIVLGKASIDRKGPAGEPGGDPGSRVDDSTYPY